MNFKRDLRPQQLETDTLEPLPFLAEIRWPAIPSPMAAGTLAVLYQLEKTQWCSPEMLAQRQGQQLAAVLEHAYATVPFYRARFDELRLKPTDVGTADGWQRLPLLSRRDIQTSQASLHSTAVPQRHGKVRVTTTGGSTGQPVSVLSTEVNEFFWRALTLRDHLWHGRDFRQVFAAIRYTDDAIGQPPAGTFIDNWGAGTRESFSTGPAYLLNVKSSLDEQAAWLRSVDPGYLLGYPSALHGLALLFETDGWRLNNLRQVLTFGEVLEPEARATCERVFGAKVVDMYSSQEVGYIALQCPACQNYHVQSESVLVEVLDETGLPCRPGAIGKVVVTTLHNFAMPLLRYEIQDYAEVGEPCACGRGLPVLKRILGRKRNLLRMPDGSLRWPVFVSNAVPQTLPPFFQFQLVQRSIDELDLNVVRPGGELSPHERDDVRRYFQAVLGFPFNIAINCVTAIPRSSTGKFEDFISLIP